MPAKRRTRASASSPTALLSATHAGSAKRSKQDQPQAVTEAVEAASPPASHSGRGIYDNTGETLLAALPDDREVEVKLFGQRLVARVVKGGAAVEVSLVTAASDRDARCEATVAQREHEATQRRADVALLKADAEAKMEEMRERFEDMGSLAQDLAELVALQGQHNKRISELESARGVQVKYEARRRREAGSLVLGQLSRLPWFERVEGEASTAVVFLAGPLGVVSTVVEETVSSEAVELAAWHRKRSPTGVFARCFGTNGTGDGEFDDPNGLTVAGGEVFVADSLNHRICVHGLDGTFRRSFGGSGSGDGEFDCPDGVAVAGNKLFVADCYNHRVCVHSLDGTFLRAFGSEGSADGQFRFPVGVSAASDRVYVVDSENYRISVHSLDGTFLLAFVSEDASEGNCPQNVIEAGGQLYVTNDVKVSVHALDGTFVRCFGSEGSGDGQFLYPSGLAVVGDSLFVVDSGNHRVSVHGLDGTFQRAFGSSGDGELATPCDVAVSDGLAFVTDSDNHRVVVWK